MTAVTLPRLAVRWHCGVRALSLAALGVVASARLAAAQCPDGTPPPCAGQAVRTPAPRSIAVLTFENVTRDTAAQYLAEGLADQIATRLGGVVRLTVISRSAVRRLRSTDQLSLQQIGRTLNAAFLVSGTIRSASGRFRVNIEAVRAASGEVLWSDAYDRAADSLLGIEEAVATEVAAGVAGRLTPQQRRALGGRVTTSGPAYAHFLRGNVLMARRSVASLRGAIAAYRAATAADTGFADAYARLGYVYALCVQWGCGDRDSLLADSRLATAHALRLDPRSSDAWMGRAHAQFVWAFSTEGAGVDDSLLASLPAFRRAVELNPRNDEAWHQYGSTLFYVDDSASLNALRRALALDPGRAITYAGALSVLYAAMGRPDRALRAVDSAFALEPDGNFHSFRASWRLALGDTAGALADARAAPGNRPDLLAAFAHDSASIRLVESRLAHVQYCEDYVSYLVWTGRREQAVRQLLQCRPSLIVRSELRSPELAPLADDPRIRALRASCDSILARARWR